MLPGVSSRTEHARQRQRSNDWSAQLLCHQAPTGHKNWCSMLLLKSLRRQANHPAQERTLASGVKDSQCEMPVSSCGAAAEPATVRVATAIACGCACSSATCPH